MARTSADVVDETAGNAIEIATGSTRNPRAHVKRIRIRNLDAAVVWVNFYRVTAAAAAAAQADDAAAVAAVRYGNPIRVAASQHVQLELDPPVQFQDRLTVLTSSAADGTGSPETGCAIDVQWQRDS